MKAEILTAVRAIIVAAPAICLLILVMCAAAVRYAARAR